MPTLDRTTVEKRVDAKIGLYNHLAVYAIFIAALVVINLLTNPRHIWFYWPMLGWGIAILFHLFAVFAFGKDSRLYRRMLDREMLRERPQ